MRWIVHADLDAFYASVEQMDNPQLQGIPVLVGGRPENRGVVAACSYEARKFGIYSAMPMLTALKRCPSAVLIRPRFSRYRQVSRNVMGFFYSITPLVEPVSLDEAYLDISSAVTDNFSPLEIAQSIKKRVHDEIGLTISIGVASSKSVAKIASGLSKPDGLKIVELGTEANFLATLSVSKLWGIGPRTERKLTQYGIETLGALAGQSDDWLKNQFGKRGLEMKSWSLGHDERPVAPERVVKSMSAEVTFAKDINEPEALKRETHKLCLKVSRRLKAAGIKGRTVTVKLRLSDFTNLTRSRTLNRAVQEPKEISEIADRILMKEVVPEKSFRLIGVGVSNLVNVEQLSFFD